MSVPHVLTANNIDQVISMVGCNSCGIYDFLYDVSCKNPNIPALPLQEQTEFMVRTGMEANLNNDKPSSARQGFQPKDIDKLLNQYEKPISLIFDLFLCDTADETKVSSSVNHATDIHQSDLSHLSYSISQLRHREPGVLVIISCTSEYRTVDSKYVEDERADHFSIDVDDSFIVVGLVPGDEPAVVKRAAVKIDDGYTLQDSKLTPIIGDIKMMLKVATDPHSCTPQYVGWHSYATIGRLVRVIRNFAEHVRYATLCLLGIDDKPLLHVRAEAGVAKATTDYFHHGFMPDVMAAINARERGDESGNIPRGNVKSSTLHALTVLMNRHNDNGYKLWRLALIELTARELHEGNPAAMAATVRHSRVLSEYIDESYEEEEMSDAQMAFGDNLQIFKLLNGNDNDEGMQFGDGHYVTECDVGPVQAHRTADHERKGFLQLPRIPQERVINRLRVVPGRGHALSTGKPSVGFPTKSARYRLRVANGKVLSKNVFRLSDMVRPFRKLSGISVGFSPLDLSFEVGLEFQVEMEGNKKKERDISNTQANHIIRGLYGTTAAMWLWANIAHGDVMVNKESKARSYLVGDVNWVDSGGLRINAPLESECLERMVMYCSEEYDAVWVDLFDNGSLRTLIRHGDGHIISLGSTIISGLDIVPEFECSLKRHVSVL